jgi:hypothetical protein
VRRREPAPWLSLFAPLPDDARPSRKPVSAAGTPGAMPESPIAGWESLTLDLSDPPFGIRIVMVTIDASGRPISASDHVMLRQVGDQPAGSNEKVAMSQSSLGGRIEEDGSFRGTFWTVEGPEPDGDELPQWLQTPRAPTDEEVARLMAIVQDVTARPHRAD